MPKLFTYGTLKRGYHNSARLLHGSRFVSAAVTTGRYTLLDGGFPRMVEGSDGYVVGELWQVSRPVLALCDRLEGHPHWYHRRRIWIMTDDGDHMRANAYVMPRARVADSRAYDGDVYNAIKPCAEGLLEWHAKHYVSRDGSIAEVPA